MNAFKCFNVTKIVIDEATAQFAPLFFIDSKKLVQLKTNCSFIDSLIKKYDCALYEIDIDSISLEIKITLTFPMTDNFTFPTDLICHGKISCHIRKDNSIDLQFHYPSIWTKISPVEVQKCLQ